MAGEASEETTAEALKSMIDGLIDGLKVDASGVAIMPTKSDMIPHHTSDEMR
jgi:hypothetical protein